MILSLTSRILFNMISMPTVVELNGADLTGNRVLLKIQSSKNTYDDYILTTMTRLP